MQPAAGIQYKNTQIFSLLQIRDNLVNPDHAAQISFVIELYIDRCKIANTGELNRVSAVIKQRDIRITRST